MNFYPGAVIVAVALKPRLPEVTGIEKGGALHVKDFLAGKEEGGENLIIIEGGFVGCEACEYLNEKRRTE